MLSVAVHKDIAEYQPKIVGKMTMRTLVSITGALSVSVLAGLYIYFVLGLNVSDSEHQTVLIQTPNTKMRYTVRFANIVKGWEPTKRTVFAGESDFRSWYDSSREYAAMVLDTDSEPNQVISLVSCSYNFWKQNERTVVTTSIDQKQAQTETVSTESPQTGSDAE